MSITAAALSSCSLSGSFHQRRGQRSQVLTQPEVLPTATPVHTPMNGLLDNPSPTPTPEVEIPPDLPDNPEKEAVLDELETALIELEMLLGSTSAWDPEIPE